MKFSFGFTMAWSRRDVEFIKSMCTLAEMIFHSSKIVLFLSFLDEIRWLRNFPFQVIPYIFLIMFISGDCRGVSKCFQVLYKIDARVLVALYFGRLSCIIMKVSFKLIFFWYRLFFKIPMVIFIFNINIHYNSNNIY